METSVTRLETPAQGGCVSGLVAYGFSRTARIAAMVAVIRRNAKGHLYIQEWMEKLNVSDVDLGNRLGVSRTTVWRWYTEQWRLNPGKIEAIAEALGIEPADFYRPPTRESIDARLSKAPDDIYDAVADLAKRLTRKAS